MPSVNKPRIAFVLSTLLSAKAFLRGHLAALAQDYEVWVFAPDDWPGALEGLEIKFQAVPIVRPVALWSDLLALLKLFLWFRRIRFNAVHTITPKAGLLGTLASWIARVPVRIHTFQGEVWATSTGLKRYIFKVLDKAIAKLTTHCTVVSYSERDFLRRERVMRHDQGCVLARGSIAGVDLQRYRLQKEVRKRRRSELGYGDGDIVGLFLGRIHPEKGIGELLRAYSTLCDKTSRAKLLIVGPQEGVVIAPADGLTVLPFTETPEQEIWAADYLILPSYREGFGVVVLEAAAASRPAIGSNIYGIQDAIIDEKTGLLVPSRDPIALANAMQRLITDNAFRYALGAAALKRAETEFSQIDVVSAMGAFYRSIPDLATTTSDCDVAILS